MSLSKIFVNSTQIVEVDNEPTAKSNNLVKSGGIEYINNIQYGLIVSIALKLGL